MEGRAALRIEEALHEADALRSELEAWFGAAPGLGAPGQYETQLLTLRRCVCGALADARQQLAGFPNGSTSGAAYDACREADRRVVLVRRIWRWYADRFDQRRDPSMGPVLSAADEVVWKSWAPMWRAAGETPGPAPLAFIDQRFIATATPRIAPPADLTAKADAVLAATVARLPVPVIGLPPTVVRRPWWLVVLVHETGHHVQYDVAPGIVDEVAVALAAAAAADGADQDEQASWDAWSRELFADAYAIVLGGRAWTWAIDELEHRPAAGLHQSPAATYPPPIVRLAVARAVLDELGVPAGATAGSGGGGGGGGGGDADDVPAVLRDSTARLTGRAAVVAAALLTCPGHLPLRRVGADTVAWQADVAAWRDDLRGEARPVARPNVDAPRLAVAGGVAEWQRLVADDEADQAHVERLRERLVELVPSCREDSVRAAPVPDTAALERATADVISLIAEGAAP